MTWLIGQIALRTGLGSLLSSLITYAVIAALAVGGYWLWSSHLYNSGYSDGSAHERAAWVAQREEDQARRDAKNAADQRKLNEIEAENLELERLLAQTHADLEEALKADNADQKPAISKNIAKAINATGRP
ncbi:hypothetical protein LB553_01240 [Mesorhizobium sp. CA8]|uniref:hypothetical protein n=1 Tax=Mesorhizobium sp. CA8 TaxID=2876637 RepID=UPI001CC9DF10|nr:hypothetical protein [Mesorhizobium sp. CA8]MBZ9759511.1 hypothetical protein [Mesorhizobium sp. CA8]